MSCKQFDRNGMRLILALALLALVSARPGAATVSGRVVDTAGKPVAGAAVVLEGRAKNVTTDAEGKFSFTTVGVMAAPRASVAGLIRGRRDGSSMRFGAAGVSADGRLPDHAANFYGLDPTGMARDAFLSGLSPEGLPSGGLAKRAAAWDTLGFSKTSFRPKRVLVGGTDSSLGDVTLYPEFSGSPVNYMGFNQYDFQVGGRAGLVVVPKRPAPGNPWIWRTYFWNHKPRFDSIMAARGYHLAFVNAPNLFGAPTAVAGMDAFYDEVTKGHGLSRKPTLVGISRGGLYAYRWSMAHPDRVSSIYGDAPVMDFVSWPCGCYGTGSGSANDWSMLKTAYSFAGDAEAKAFGGNPYANMKMFAQAKIPLIHVYGETDEVVPAKENILRANDSLKAYGWPMRLLPKPGTGYVHGPSASDGGLPGQMDTLVQFILRNTSF